MISPYNSVYNGWQFRYPGRPARVLGAYVPYGKLSSRIYVPTRRDRAQLAGKQPFDVVFGGAQDDVALGSNQSINLRYVVPSDFIWLTLQVSETQGTPAAPGCRVEIKDISTMPGRGKRLSTSGGVNSRNLAGSGAKPKYVRKPYKFVAGRTIQVTIVNLKSVSNKIQVVLSGVLDT